MEISGWTYFWMRDRNDPEVIAHLEAEATPSAMTQHTEVLQTTLYEGSLASKKPTFQSHTAR